MDFDWTDKDREIKKQVNSVFDETAREELEALEEADLPELRRITTRIMRDLARTGYLSIEFGPSARSETLYLMAAQEELARFSGSFFLCAEVTARVFGGLLRWFPKSSRVKAMQAALEKGDLIGAVAVTEPANDGDSQALTTVAWADGSHYVVTGSKDFVTNGPIADYVAVLAHIDGRPAFCLVESGLSGLAFGRRMKTVGYNGLAVSALQLNEVTVHKDFVLGLLEDDYPLTFVALIQDMVFAMASVGLMQRTISEAKQYSGRHQRGGKAIFAHQEIRFKLAEMLTLYQTSQLLVFRAGWLYSISDPEAATVIHCAKVFTSEASEKIASMAMQIMAGPAYIHGNLTERAYREAKYAALAGTTSEIARMAIADDILRRYS